MSRILWRNGSTYAQSFMDPESNYLYLRNSKRPETVIVVSIRDLAEIIAAQQTPGLDVK